MRLYQGDEREKKRDRQTDRHRDRETQTDRQTDRQRKTQRQRRWREMGAGAIKLHCLVVFFNRWSFSDDQFRQQRCVAGKMRQGIPTFHCSVSVLTSPAEKREENPFCIRVGLLVSCCTATLVE